MKKIMKLFAACLISTPRRTEGDKFNLFVCKQFGQCRVFAYHMVTLL